MTKFYITTTAPYVNSDPHIGFALEIIQADAIARYHQLLGEDVFFNTGTDEHGVKIYRKALEAKKDPQSFTDQHAAKFAQLKTVLNLSNLHSIRTTDPKHIAAAQEFWKRSFKNGDIDKKFYKIKYCSGCELEKTDSELENGKCSIHPNLEIDIIEEENYFFRFSKYQKPLLEFYEKNPQFVVPQYRFNEIINFVKQGLEDFSVSRLKSKMPWGVDVPGDPDHVMYVWFDALVFYISSIGWPKKADFDGYWPGMQIAGKDNLRQQSAIWQAMLMSAGLPNSSQILIHGFITSGGQKMSKSLGNVIDPIVLSKKYGAEALRYYLLAKVHPFNDNNFTIPLFEEVYNADLANGLGNLVARIETIIKNKKFNLHEATKDSPINQERIISELSTFMDNYRSDRALEYIWGWIHGLDKWLDRERPWEKSSDSSIKKLGEIIVGTSAVLSIRDIAWALKPFLPNTSEEILKRFNVKMIKDVGKPLFPRL